MSWLRSAINKAAEVGGKNIAPNLSRTVRSVAQHAGQAVAGGAKLVQDRLSGRNLNSFKHAVRRLDEVALNARGTERVQALARWLGALVEIGRDAVFPSIVEESRTPKSEDATATGAFDEVPSPRKASMVFFFDSDNDGEPMNFRELFLRSHAIENIVTSMILEAPVDDEIAMLVDVFGLCLGGGKELHNAIISSIQDLAKALASYKQEVMAKRDDLLQYARDAVSGLKLNADVEGLDAQIAIIKQQIIDKQGGDILKEEITSLQLPVGVAQNASEELSLLLAEGSKKTEEVLHLGSELQDLLQKKRLLLCKGDSQKTRAEKVELLKSLSESLSKATADAEKLIADNRNQKIEALKYRATKAQEVEEVEKTVGAEVKMLEKRKNELEAELKEVNAALAAATSRHINTQEEKEQFDEASTKIVAHLTIQEENLTQLIDAQKQEVGVIETWLSFLGDTWQLQASCMGQKEKDIENAFGEAKLQYFQTVIINLSYQQEELNLLLKQLKFYSEELMEIAKKRLGREESVESGMDVSSDIIKAKRKLQERYLEAEGQAVKVLKRIEFWKKDLQPYATVTSGNKDLEKSVLDAFEAIYKIQKELENLPRPDFEVVDIPTSTPVSLSRKSSVKWADTSGLQDKELHQETHPQVYGAGESRDRLTEVLRQTDKQADIEDSIDYDPTDLQTNENKDIEGYAQEEIAGWEFDELEEELNEDGA
eukprot:c25584_g1_i1 orf=559-2697(-)